MKLTPTTNQVKLGVKLKGFETINDRAKKKIGLEIKEAMVNKGVTPSRIKKDIGVQHLALKNIISGKSDYTIGTLNKLRFYLNLPIIEDVNEC